MKKKLLLVLFCSIIILGSAGCSKKNDKDINLTDKDMYLEVLNNKRNYIAEDNKKKSIEDFEDQMNFVPTIKYVVFDLDGDEKDEMVILFEGKDAYYLILNVEDDNVYGFEKGYRAMTSIKEDGTLLGSDGSSSSEIYKVSFEKNMMNMESLAIEDGKTYKLNGEKASKTDVQKYFKEFNAKKDVEFVEFK